VTRQRDFCERLDTRGSPLVLEILSHPAHINLYVDIYLPIFTSSYSYSSNSDLLYIYIYCPPICQEKIFPRNLALTLQVPSVQMLTFTKICICNSVWHLLVFYLNYIVKKHLKEIFFLAFEVLVEMYYYLPMNFDFGTSEITAGTYRVIYSLYDRRPLSLIYGRCVYKMNVNTPWKHARSCCIYTDTVWHCDHYTHNLGDRLPLTVWEERALV
jgi:hypothetical protein